MTRKFSFLLLAIVGMTLQSLAQLPFSVNAPKYQKFVKVTSTDVNLRKSPNANSPRLVFSESDGGCLDCEASLIWSSKTLRKGDEPARASLLPVIGESGEWYHVHFFQDNYGDGGYLENAYVMKKFCLDVNLRPLNLPTPQSLNIIKVNNGKYRGLCIEWLNGYMDNTLLRVGGYVDGMFVFPYSIYFSCNEDDNESYFTNWGNGDVIQFGKNLFDEWNLNLRRLVANTKVLDMLMSNIKKMKKDNTVYYGIEGDSEWHVLR